MKFVWFEPGGGTAVLEWSEVAVTVGYSVLGAELGIMSFALGS